MENKKITYIIFVIVCVALFLGAMVYLVHSLFTSLEAGYIEANNGYNTKIQPLLDESIDANTTALEAARTIDLICSVYSQPIPQLSENGCKGRAASWYHNTFVNQSR